MTLLVRPAGNRRITGKEQFYTPPDCAEQVVSRLLEQIPAAAGAVWLEPSAGTGVFVDAARQAGISNVISYDIEPLHPEIINSDYLTAELGPSGSVVYGNPPYGRNNALAIPFFNRAAMYADTICFIVPRSWRKWSITNRLDLGFRCVDDYNINVDYLDAGGRRLSARRRLRTAVQTWVRTDHARTRICVTDRGVLHRAVPHEADVAVTVFGHGCGTIRTDFVHEPNSTVLFYRFGHHRALEALHAVDFTKFSDHTAFTESVSTAEINYLLNMYLDGDPGIYNPDR